MKKEMTCEEWTELNTRLSLVRNELLTISATVINRLGKKRVALIDKAIKLLDEERTTLENMVWHNPPSGWDELSYNEQNNVAWGHHYNKELYTARYELVTEYINME